MPRYVGSTCQSNEELERLQALRCRRGAGVRRRRAAADRDPMADLDERPRLPVLAGGDAPSAPESPARRGRRLRTDGGFRARPRPGFRRKPRWRPGISSSGTPALNQRRDRARTSPSPDPAVSGAPARPAGHRPLKHPPWSPSWISPRQPLPGGARRHRAAYADVPRPAPNGAGSLRRCRCRRGRRFP